MLLQGSVGKNGISPAASAAHARTMRKGSTEHLALNIDLETGSLMNHEETDEDKGLDSNFEGFVLLNRIFIGGTIQIIFLWQVTSSSP